MSTTPVDKARAAFEKYAGSGQTPDAMSSLQCKLSAWQNRNFPGGNIRDLALGAGEEIGELFHAILKHSQRIRSMQDPATFNDAAGDAIADTTIFLMQICTVLRLDFRTLVHGVAEQVLRRDWTNDKNAGVSDAG